MSAEAPDGVVPHDAVRIMLRPIASSLPNCDLTDTKSGFPAHKRG